MLNKLIIATVLSLVFGFTPAAFAEQKSQAQIQHDKDCAALKASYDYVLAYAKENPTKRRKFFLSAYNMKLIGRDKKCAWATQA